MTSVARLLASGRREPADGRRGGALPSTPAAISRLTPAARLIVLLAALGLFMHGCHGPDEDHEPAVTPPVREVGP